MLLALVLTACQVDDAPPTPDDPDEVAPPDPTADEPVVDAHERYCDDGGDAPLAWFHDQEPPDLHLDDPNNNLSITSWIRQALWEGPFGVSAATTFVPELVDTREIEETDDGWRYTFTLRPGLRWSDGTPLTAEHVAGTYRILMEGYDHRTGEGGIYRMGSREAAGYHLIDPGSWVVDGLTYSFTTERFSSGYHAWFDPILPTHVIPDAATANAALPGFELDGQILPSSGPLLFGSWDRGERIRLVRNEDYHGAHPDHPDVVNPGAACVTAVEVRFVEDSDALLAALLDGRADLAMTQPQIAFGERITGDDRFTVASQAGPFWEHWGMNLHNEHLADPDVREALALAMDKREVIAALYAPMFGDLLPETGLGNVYWMSNQPDYVDHTLDAGYGVGDVDGARALLEGVGYVLGPDGIHVHPERGPLVLRAGTTGGNHLRERQLELLSEQLRRAGIGIEVDSLPGERYLLERPFAPEAIACAVSGGLEGDCTVWDLAQFAWLGGPWPGSAHGAFLSGSMLNPYGYANPAFDARTEECDTTVDEDERARCYNELSAYVTTRTLDPDGLVVLPISQKPSFYAYRSDRLLRGSVAPDAQAGGPLVNVVDMLPVP